MVSMMFTIFAALVLLPGSARTESTAPRVTAVATANARIVSGVRISREQVIGDNDTPSRATRLPKPRERPCPETDTPPCRLIVVDMP